MTNGGKLLAALHDADDRIAALWAEFKSLREEGTTIPQTGGFWGRLHQAQADRSAIADRTWAYFDGPGATAEEHAAWVLIGCCRCRRPLGGSRG